MWFSLVGVDGLHSSLLPCSSHISHIKPILKMRGGGSLWESWKHVPSNLPLATLSSGDRDKHIVSISLRSISLS